MPLALAHNVRLTVRDWSKVLPLEQAAGRLAVSMETLRRRCMAELAGNGLAFYDRPAAGGKPAWFVSMSLDVRLQPSILSDRYAEPDLTRFTAKQREGIFARRHCLEKLAELERTMPTTAIPVLHAAVIAFAAGQYPGLSVSSKSLYRWRKNYKFPADLATLADARGGDRRSQGSDAAWAAFRSLYLHQNRPAAREVWRLVGGLAKEQGWAWCTYASCRNQLDSRVSLNEQVKRRQPRKYRECLAPTIAPEPDSYAAGKMWLSDHKQLDVMCRWKGGNIRPWLTTWMDWRTRKVVGYVLADSPNSSTILAALRHGLLDKSNHGGPDEVWIDNGKDFAAALFHGTTKYERRVNFRTNPAAANGIFAMAKIKAHFALPYNPNGKGRLERWFRNTTTFARTFPTYVGMGIDDKPEALAAVLKSGRNIPKFDEVAGRLADYIAAYNANADHAMGDLAENGERLSPAVALDRWCPSVKVVDRPRWR